MDYFKHYDLLTTKAKNRFLKDTTYTEKHHIIPRCIGGDNKKQNIVRLTYREHFIAHWLLCKMYPFHYGLKAALTKMLGVSCNGDRKVTSWMIDAAKRQVKDKGFPWLKEYSATKKSWCNGTKGLVKAWNKGKSGVYVRSETAKEKTSQSLKKYWQTHKHNRIGVEPWNKGTKGLVKAWNKGIPAKKDICIYCGKSASVLNIKRWHNDNCKFVRKQNEKDD